MTAELFSAHPDLYAAAAVGTPTTLVASRCPQCGRHQFPARTECPACSTSTERAELAGPARLRVLTGVHAQPPGSRVEAPYDVGVAEFDEGICVLGLVVGDASKGDLVRPVVTEPYEGGHIFGFAADA